MGVEGIGASVVRKEDRRFITGKGRYVDDIKLQGMTHAHFVRSPHAHAKVKAIDSSAAMKMPGVVGVLTGQQIVDDKVGNLICGWAVSSKDGTPMKMGAWPAMAPETVRFVGQAVAVVIAETKNQAKDAAEAVVVERRFAEVVISSILYRSLPRHTPLCSPKLPRPPGPANRRPGAHPSHGMIVGRVGCKRLDILFLALPVLQAANLDRIQTLEIKRCGKVDWISCKD